MGDKVHSYNSNCIYSIVKSNGDSIEFSLSITEQRAVGFIPAWSLASLHSGNTIQMNIELLEDTSSSNLLSDTLYHK